MSRDGHDDAGADGVGAHDGTSDAPPARTRDPLAFGGALGAVLAGVITGFAVAAVPGVILASAWRLPPEEIEKYLFTLAGLALLGCIVCPVLVAAVLRRRVDGPRFVSVFVATHALVVGLGVLAGWLVVYPGGRWPAGVSWFITAAWLFAVLPLVWSLPAAATGLVGRRWVRAQIVGGLALAALLAGAGALRLLIA